MGVNLPYRRHSQGQQKCSHSVQVSEREKLHAPTAHRGSNGRWEWHWSEACAHASVCRNQLALDSGYFLASTA